ncbi:16S rRNA (cytidine(1402)-2'-O)-methyltransferase [Dehalogenimonas etheniformans]|uniref:Ribosomal RNA small subunit methyltransferase I n=1 Tax=Dehalogenimonas etheniformans TaxID=1536648 RepID=A0A2P5P520_9CHLR|nr:16S rRNA (cytidine(1402)-2'-O)-methyltransferase [Dehalogenimonas etheniformans]PPD57377.1 16S rRNA (cytidine(1402)-2'-O)-methyltransferase [Dehalogenimonas etheniformans]QNT75228.1 16S rRNA (cytidine(1402)-2'-O)-methyltransferase [Dehalogenimonas etheniformans]
MPTLFVVATPIGNLEDITLRAMRILKEVSLIAAEDTRHTLKLLNAMGIKTPLTSYYEHNKSTKLDYVLDQLEKGDVALVSDAGTPGIADPGSELIAAAIKRGFRVEAVPGPSAVMTALVVSGLPTAQFKFIAFLPRKVSERRTVIQELSGETATIVFLEAPHRFRTTAEALLEGLGDRRVAICRELTKIHEEVFRGKISDALAHFIEPRGEFVLVVEGKGIVEAKPMPVNEVETQLCKLKRNGVSAKEATTMLADKMGLSRRELYKAWLKLE